jgi:hypothetical protein
MILFIHPQSFRKGQGGGGVRIQIQGNLYINIGIDIGMDRIDTYKTYR